MEARYRDGQTKTQPVILELEHDGLRVLARIIARLHLEKTSVKKGGGRTHDIRKR